MQQKIDTLINEIETFAAQTKEEVEGFRIKYFGKKGVLADLFAEMKGFQTIGHRLRHAIARSYRVALLERQGAFGAM